MKYAFSAIALAAFLAAPCVADPTAHDNRVALAEASRRILDGQFEGEALRTQLRNFVSRPAVPLFDALEEASLDEDGHQTATRHLRRITAARTALATLVSATPLDRVLIRSFLTAVRTETLSLDSLVRPN